MRFKRLLILALWVCSGQLSADNTPSEVPLDLTDLTDPALENFVVVPNSAIKKSQNSRETIVTSNQVKNKRAISTSTNNSSIIGGIVEFNNRARDPSFLEGPEVLSPNSLFENTKSKAFRIESQTTKSLKNEP